MIPLLNRYHKSEAEWNKRKLSKASQALTSFNDFDKYLNTNYLGRRTERQEALDRFAKRRVEAEMQRRQRLEAHRKQQELVAAAQTEPNTQEKANMLAEISNKVKAHLDSPAVKEEIARKAVDAVRDKLGN